MNYRFLFALLPALLIACAANIRDTDLLVSNTFLLPPPLTKTVFIQNHNTSENPQVTLSDLERRLTAKGYSVVNDRQSARFVLYTNIVYCNQTEPHWPAEAIVSGGYGSKPTSDLDPTIGDMASRVIEAINNYLNSLSPATGSVYACVADLQVTDREKAGDAPAAAPVPGNRPPAGVYRIRIGATVNQKKFDEKEATQVVQQKLSAAMAGYL